MEGLCVLRLLLSKVDDKRSRSSLIYRLSCVGFVISCVYFGNVSSSLSLQTSASLPPLAMLAMIMQQTRLNVLIDYWCPIITHIVILIRLKRFSGNVPWLFYAFLGLTVVHLVCFAVSAYYGYTIFGLPLFFLDPGFKIFLKLKLVCTLVDTLINIVATAVFIKQIADSAGITNARLFRDLFVKYEGTRWTFLVMTHTFYAYAFIYTLFVDTSSPLTGLINCTVVHGRYVASVTSQVQPVKRQDSQKKRDSMLSPRVAASKQIRNSTLQA
ncbi:hypothetical protein EDD86DRAFT_249850 [Gorgonomyces haynaldii]|nr:hypothetical protein EDD86DRAFT_249850 [Gorgonomyces haynaldii]